jgi:hypothetical protein
MWIGKVRRNIRLLRGELTGRNSGYIVRYIDLTTGRTQEKRFTEREIPDLYKLQREGKVSIISIHKVSSPVREFLKEREPLVPRKKLINLFEERSKNPDDLVILGAPTTVPKVHHH